MMCEEMLVPDEEADAKSPEVIEAVAPFLPRRDFSGGARAAWRRRLVDDSMTSNVVLLC